MVTPRGRGSDIRNRTHGRDALNGGRSSGRGRHGDGGSRGSRSTGRSSTARVGVTGRGRRRLPHSRPEAMVRLYHSLVGEGVEMGRIGGKNASKMKWNGNERRRGGGGV